MKSFRPYLSLYRSEVPSSFCLNQLFIAAFTRGCYFNSTVFVTGPRCHTFKIQFNIILRPIFQHLWRSIPSVFRLKFRTGYSSSHAYHMRWSCRKFLSFVFDYIICEECRRWIHKFFIKYIIFSVFLRKWLQNI
jgi:hypothetical protein